MTDGAAPIVMMTIADKIKMKTVGIIGGLSPESTIKYYQWLNQGAVDRLGASHSANVIISSVDFGHFKELKEKGDWDTQSQILVERAQGLERAGADFIILATNTMHKMATEIEAAISIPFLHLADATAQRIKNDGLKTIGLLGTKYTMEMDFYKNRLIKHNINVLIPDNKDRKIVNDVIYNELCHGIIKDSSRNAYNTIVSQLAGQGAEGVIMGCTEITILLRSEEITTPLFDTTKIHVEEALKFMFDE